jgi:hypothetical protein
MPLQGKSVIQDLFLSLPSVSTMILIFRSTRRLYSITKILFHWTELCLQRFGVCVRTSSKGFSSVHNLHCHGNRPMWYLVSVATWGFLKGEASYLCFGIELLFYVQTDYMPCVTVVLWFHSLLFKWVDVTGRSVRIQFVRNLHPRKFQDEVKKVLPRTNFN